MKVKEAFKESFSNACEFMKIISFAVLCAFSMAAVLILFVGAIVCSGEFVFNRIGIQWLSEIGAFFTGLFVFFIEAFIIRFAYLLFSND